MWRAEQTAISAISTKAVTFLLAINALLYAYAAWRCLFYLGDLTVPEGAIVYCVEGLVTGKWPLYRDYNMVPYGTTPYTPLYYLLSGALVWGTTKTVSSIYICCRVLTFAATLVAAFFVRRIVLLLRRGAGPVYSAFLLPFTVLTLIAWGFAARPDMLAIMMSLIGIYIYLRESRLPHNVAGSAVILAFAWACKQSFIAAPTAIFLSLLWERRWRHAALFVMSYISVIAIFAGVTQYLSQGQFFNNIITANVTDLKTDQVYWLTVDGYFYLAPFIVVATLLTCLIYRWDIVTKHKMRCITLYLVLSVALNLVACMKEGAYFNYLIEPLFIASILAACGMLWLLSRGVFAAAVPPLLLASLLFSYHFYWYYDGAPEHALSADIAEENVGVQAIVDKINAVKGDVLTPTSVFAVRSAKPVLATDLFNTRYLEQKGKLSTQALAGRIRRRELGAIVAPQSCQPSSIAPNCQSWPLRLKEAALDAYAPSETFDGQVFWYPKPR